MGMWNETSRKAAYEQFGRDNYGWLALFHALPKILAVAAVGGLVWVGWWAWHHAPGVHVPWVTVLAGAGIVVGALVLWRLATRSRRRGYRIPRSRY